VVRGAFTKLALTCTPTRLDPGIVPPPKLVTVSRSGLVEPQPDVAAAGIVGSAGDVARA
jgi:hypothetical protein